VAVGQSGFEMLIKSGVGRKPRKEPLPDLTALHGPVGNHQFTTAGSPWPTGKLAHAKLQPSTVQPRRSEPQYLPDCRW
jgi:hypothetical protein